MRIYIRVRTNLVSSLKFNLKFSSGQIGAYLMGMNIIHLPPEMSLPKLNKESKPQLGFSLPAPLPGTRPAVWGKTCRVPRVQRGSVGAGARCAAVQGLCPSVTYATGLASLQGQANSSTSVGGHACHPRWTGRRGGHRV